MSYLNPRRLHFRLSIMFELKTMAEELLGQPLANGDFAGPRFRYMPD